MSKVPLRDGWSHFRGSLGGVWEVWRGFRFHTHYDPSWQSVDLPHSYNAFDCVDPDSCYYQGTGWYRNLVEVNNPFPEGRTLLQFDGLGQRCDVYVHTEHVTQHPDPYDAFTCDISESVNRVQPLEAFDGRVPIAIRCDNSRDLESIPSDISDFNLYGGLFRPVWLHYVPAISLRDIGIATEYESGAAEANIQVEVDIHNPLVKRDDVTLTFELLDIDGNLVAEQGVSLHSQDREQCTARFTIREPSLWSPDKPDRYECVASLSSSWGEHERRKKFGIRTFEFASKGPFYLNGKRLLLRGTQRHEDHAGVGPAMSTSEIRDEMQLIKNMGANFIRLGHYPQSDLVLDLCDELGILVYEEIPWCRGGLGGEQYQRQSVRMLRTMIEQHKHHPSVIVWGLGNENDWPGDFEVFDQAVIRRHMQLLHTTAHELDPSRVTGIRRCDFCKDIVDVYSPSIWAGWYRGVYTEYEHYLREHFSDVDRLLHLEWGADNIAGRRAEAPFTGIEQITRGLGAEERDGDFFLHGGQKRVSRDGEWSEDYFCELVDWYLHVQEHLDWFAGSAQWVFKDFSTPIRPENPIPYVNCKGVVERDLTPKEGYYVFQSYWATEPMAHIHGHHFPVRWGRIDQPREVRVYSNCPSVELLVNGSSQGVRRRNVHDFPACGLRWDIVFEQGINRLEAVAYDQKSHGIATDTLEIDYRSETWGSPESLYLTVSNRGDHTHEISVTVRDAQGNWCLDDMSWVRFSIAGDGKLNSELGTVSGSRVLQLSNGRGQISMDTRGGRSVVSVQSPHLPTAFVTVDDTLEHQYG